MNFMITPSTFEHQQTGLWFASQDLGHQRRIDGVTSFVLWRSAPNICSMYGATSLLIPYKYENDASYNLHCSFIHTYGRCAFHSYMPARRSIKNMDIAFIHTCFRASRWKTQNKSSCKSVCVTLCSKEEVAAAGSSVCCERWFNEAATAYADITADHRDIPTLRTLWQTSLLFHAGLRLFRYFRFFMSVENIPCLSPTQHFSVAWHDWFRLSRSTPQCAAHQVCSLPVEFRKPPMMARIPVWSSRVGALVLTRLTPSAGVHLLPAFSRLILGLAFLSCFPVALFMYMRLCGCSLCLQLKASAIWQSDQATPPNVHLAHLQHQQFPVFQQSFFRNAKRPNRPVGGSFAVCCN